jgi:hypothetical protein
MPFGAAAIVGSAAIGLAGSALQANAVKDASGKAIDAQQAAEEEARGDLAPWRDTGGTADTATADILGLNGPDAATAAMGRYTTSPGYQWQLGQGLRAIDAGAASKGILDSGATLKAEETFGQGLANQDFGTYYNRLFDLSKLGEAAGAKSADQSITTGTGIAQTDLSAGSAMSNIIGNAASGVGNAINQYQNNSLYQARTNALSGGGGFTDAGTWTV